MFSLMIYLEAAQSYESRSLYILKKKLQESVTQHMAMHTNLMGAKNNSQ